MSVAGIIAEQIGSRAFYMMGAKNLTSSENGTALTWKMGRGASGAGGKVTHMKVTLDAASDTYVVESIRVNVRAAEMVKVLEREEGIYVDMLAGRISALTGYALSL